MIAQNKTDDKLIRTIQSKFNKTIKEYGLIEDDDHILIGLSGGKDSLALIELMGHKMKIFSPKFKATAVHVTVENINYQSDIDFLSNFSNRHGISFLHRTTSYDQSSDTRKSNCFLCSWNRRKVLFETAKELGCSKIALGHHLDDLAETLLMNMIYQGAYGTMPPILEMNKFDMTIIRPMSLIQEKEIIALEKIRNYPKQIKNCPFEKDSSRSKAKELIIELEKWNPHIRQSLWRAMENIQYDYLPHKLNSFTK